MRHNYWISPHLPHTDMLRSTLASVIVIAAIDCLRVVQAERLVARTHRQQQRNATRLHSSLSTMTTCQPVRGDENSIFTGAAQHYTSTFLCCSTRH